MPSYECFPFTPGQLLLNMPNISSILQLQPFFNTLSSMKSESRNFNSFNSSVKTSKKDKPVCEISSSPISKSRSAPDLHTLLNSTALTQETTSKSTTEQIELILESDFLEPLESVQ